MACWNSILKWQSFAIIKNAKQIIFIATPFLWKLNSFILIFVDWIPPHSKPHRGMCRKECISTRITINYCIFAFFQPVYGSSCFSIFHRYNGCFCRHVPPRTFQHGFTSHLSTSRRIFQFDRFTTHRHHATTSSMLRLRQAWKPICYSKTIHCCEWQIVIVGWQIHYYLVNTVSKSCLGNSNAWVYSSKHLGLFSQSLLAKFKLAGGLRHTAFSIWQFDFSPTVISS